MPGTANEATRSVSVERAEPLLYESHMHTPLCRHASGWPGEYARVAVGRGLRGVIVTCHAPMPDGYSADVRMRVDQFPEYLACVEQAASEWAGRAEILLGIESDYVPGMEDWVRRLHERAPFHHVLGSVHPQVREFKARFYRGDDVAYQRLYFEHLAEAAETRLFDTLAHPDLIKNEAPDAWNLERILPDIRRALDRIAASGVAMELNTSGMNKRLPEMNPGPAILREMRERGIPVVVGADAHVPGRVGDGYVEALEMLEAAGYEAVSGFRERRRFEVPIPKALASLRSP
ncbi:MAG: histidinol-phosphatase [Terrimicrobiaceae bacterium]|nr:histidinol-phosphatase [Terrimicrobiaceae bacterium]